MKEQVKCVVVGDQGVGKSCMIQSYTEGWRGIPEYVLCVWHNPNIDLLVDGTQVELRLWDSQGRSEYEVRYRIPTQTFFSYVSLWCSLNRMEMSTGNGTLS